MWAELGADLWVELRAGPFWETLVVSWPQVHGGCGSASVSVTLKWAKGRHRDTAPLHISRFAKACGFCHTEWELAVPRREGCGWCGQACCGVGMAVGGVCAAYHHWDT